MEALACDFNGRAIATLRGLDRDMRRRIGYALWKRQLDPYARGLLKMFVRPGEEQKYRFRVGTFRVVYAIREHSLWVFEVDDRKDIYRGL